MSPYLVFLPFGLHKETVALKGPSDQMLARPSETVLLTAFLYASKMYIQAYKSSNLRMKIIKNDFPSHPLYLEGALTRSTHYQQYQPVITLQKGYTIHWDQTAPAELAIWLINFNK